VFLTGSLAVLKTQRVPLGEATPNRLQTPY